MNSKQLLGALTSIALLACAGAAQAGSAVVTSVNGAPSTSVVGQSVAITATIGAFTSCEIQFQDATNGNAVLCPGVDTGITNTAVCNHTFTTPGVRTVRAVRVAGGCAGSQTYTQTVNSAAAGVPTVSEWTLWGMMGLMMMAGAALLVRRTRRQSVMGE